MMIIDDNWCSSTDRADQLIFAFVQEQFVLFSRTFDAARFVATRLSLSNKALEGNAYYKLFLTSILK